MSKAVKSVFGGMDRSGQRATMAQNELSRDFIQQQMGQAQNYLGGMLPQAQGMIGAGFGGAMDALNMGLPMQLNALGQGHSAAQQYLLSGMPQFENAIMGRPVDYSQFQPMQMPVDASQLQMRLPSQLLGGGM